MDGGEVAWLEGIQIETFLNCAANCEKWVGLGDFWLLCFFIGLVNACKLVFMKSEIVPVVFECVQVGRRLDENREKSNYLRNDGEKSKIDPVVFE